MSKINYDPIGFYARSATWGMWHTVEGLSIKDTASLHCVLRNWQQHAWILVATCACRKCQYDHWRALTSVQYPHA